MRAFDVPRRVRKSTPGLRRSPGFDEAPRDERVELGVIAGGRPKADQRGEVEDEDDHEEEDERAVVQAELPSELPPFLGESREVPPVQDDVPGSGAQQKPPRRSRPRPSRDEPKGQIDEGNHGQPRHDRRHPADR